MTGRIAFQGELGAYSHQACRETRPEFDVVPCRTFEDVIEAVRAGKADPRMLDNISVDYYGSETPLTQVSNINTPDARTIKIQPWEKNMIDPMPDTQTLNLKKQAPASIKLKCVRIFHKLVIVLIFRNVSSLMGCMNYINQCQLQKNHIVPNYVNLFGKKDAVAMGLDANSHTAKNLIMNKEQYWF